MIERSKLRKTRVNPHDTCNSNLVLILRCPTLCDPEAPVQEFALKAKEARARSAKNPNRPNDPRKTIKPNKLNNSIASWKSGGAHGKPDDRKTNLSVGEPPNNQ
jgi:hypothetical protein